MKSQIKNFIRLKNLSFQFQENFLQIKKSTLKNNPTDIFVPSYKVVLRVLFIKGKPFFLIIMIYNIDDSVTQLMVSISLKDLLCPHSGKPFLL